MTYQKDSWLTVRDRLQQARESMTAYRSLPKEQQDRRRLDEMVWLCWTFGEYAVNVCLEMHQRDVVKDHTQHSQAKLLHLEGLLTQDYSQRLEQLELFRLQASHLSYNRRRSTHYNATNIENCLDALESLAQEIEALLRLKGKL